MTTYTTADVNAWYQAVQFQAGPTATVNTWVSALNAGTITPAQVQNSIITQDTYTLGVVNPVLRLYQAAFASVPDQAGQAYWVGQFGTGAQTYQQIANGFANSSQFKTAYGTTGATQAATSAVVTTMYYNILLRAPDAGGLAYWTGKAIGDVLAGISTSPEMINDMSVPITGFQQAEINLNPATSGSMYQYPGFPTTNYVLTTGVDAPGTGAFASSVGFSVGSNTTTFGTFNGATGNTFTAGDQITAASGTTNATLNLSDAGSGSGSNVNSVAALVSNINNLVANSGEALVANTTTWNGLTQITATTASNASNFSFGVAAANSQNLTSITAGSATNVTVTDTATQIAGTGNGGVTVLGGKNVSITENGATTVASGITIGAGASSLPAGTVSVVANRVSTANPGNTTIFINGGTTVSATQGQTGSVTIGATTAATGAVTVTNTNGALNNTNTATPISNITVTGGSSIAITNNALIAGQGQLGFGSGIIATGNTSTTTITVNQTGVYGSLGAFTNPAATTANGGFAAGVAAGTNLVLASGANGGAGDALYSAGTFIGTVANVNGNNVQLQGATAAAVANGGALNFVKAFAPGVVNSNNAAAAATTATNGITINRGTNVTVNTTGNFGGGQIAVGGTTAPTGTVSITNTNSRFGSADAISVDANAANNTTGAITINTTRSSGAIQVGTNAAAQGVTGNVTINNSTTAGGVTWYGTGTVNVSTTGATSVSVTGGAAGGGSTIIDNGATKALAAVTLNGFSGAITVGATNAATVSVLTTVNINNNANRAYANVTVGA